MSIRNGIDHSQNPQHNPLTGERVARATKLNRDLTTQLSDAGWRPLWSLNARNADGFVHAFQITAWAKNGRVLLTQEFAEHGYEIFYASPTMKVDALKDEIEGYARWGIKTEMQRYLNIGGKLPHGDEDATEADLQREAQADRKRDDHVFGPEDR